MEYSQELSEYAAGLKFEDLPGNVVEAAKLTILDTLGCAIGTHKDEPEKPEVANAFVREMAGPPQATVILGGFKTHMSLAALANGVVCHGIDFDDTHKEALTHTSCVIVPAALATAEAMGRSGKDLVLSYVLGYEVAVRVGMAVMPTHYEFWHSTATNGTFGAAVAAGKNFGFDAGKMRHALGASGTQAAGLLTYLEFGDLTKSFNPGKSALNGIFAALLARAGGTAPPVMLEHKKGYCQAYSKAPKLDRLTRGLGTTYELLTNGIKPYPSLLASHPPLDAVIKLVKENNLRPEDIVSIVNRTYNTVKTHFSNYDPKTVMAARLSVPYCIAVAAVKGRAGLEEFHEEVINEPAVQEMLKKVEIIADPELNKLYPEKFPAQVTITARNGNTYRHDVYSPKGDANNPLTAGEIQDKFRMLCEGPIAKDRCEKIIEEIMGLESVADVRELAALLA